MKLRNRGVGEAEVDMTPMIDMVFLLLIFFMCAATMSKVDFTPEIELPVAEKSEVPEDLRGRRTVNILPVGYQLPDGRTVSEELPFMVSGKLVNAEDLTALVIKEAEGEKLFKVNMRIDRQVHFKKVREAIKACADAGVYDIIFASYQSSGGGS